MRALMVTTALVISAFGAQIDWVKNYKEAGEKALREHKNVLVVITTESCRWCRRFEATTLQDAAVVSRINARFAAVHVTRGRDDYPAELEAKMVPMSYFLLPDGTVLYGMPGFWDTEDYLSILDDAEKKAARLAGSKEKQ